MRLAWLTDIHLDFVDEAAVTALGRAAAAGGIDALLVTGDIAAAASLVSRLELLQRAAGAPLYFVLGNHDFYGGRIDDVRASARSLAAPLSWLPAHGPVALGGDSWLVGVDGWGDARLGCPEESKIALNDFVHIADLLEASADDDLLPRLRALGDAEAVVLRGLCARVPASARRLVVATHVPPFKDACWHEGEISSDEWLPFFTCDAVGRELRAFAASRPSLDVIALCGHTHGAGVARIAPNLEVRTGGARYGAPVVAGFLDV